MRQLTFLESRVTESHGYIEIFDGQEIMSDPQNEYGLLLDFFGLERFELEWTFNKEKGFHCLSYPVNYCLGKK